jgi:hypothetical protein
LPPSWSLPHPGFFNSQWLSTIIEHSVLGQCQLLQDRSHFSLLALWNLQYITIIYSHLVCKSTPEILVPLCYLAPINQPFLFLLILPSSASGNHHFTDNFYEINFFQISHMSEHMGYLSFCAWLISLNIIIYRTIHVVVKDRILYFSWMNSILLYICTSF